MSQNVGIVIVSHSADVARGTALMVEQMVGREVPLGWCGGDPGGGLGTSVEAIMRAIEQACGSFWGDISIISPSMSMTLRPSKKPASASR